MDGQLLWQSPDAAPGSDSVRVVLAGRATDGPVVHDDVAIYQGILLHP